MADKVRMISPLLTVVLEDGADEYAEHEIQTDNRDLLAYEKVAAKRGWPVDGRERPITWMTYLAWHALTREGLADESSYDSFADRCVNIDPQITAVDPTGPAVEAGS